MNIRVRKILTYRWLSAALLLLSIGLSTFSLYRVITLKPEKIVLDCIALGLTISFAIAQIVLIMRGWKKESHLIDIAFNNDYTVNKFPMVVTIIGAALGLALDIMAIIVLCTRENTIAVICSMFIILAISSYLLLNTIIYLSFLLIFRKKELTIEDYAK